MRWTSLLGCGLLGLLCVGGCAKVNVDITKDLDVGQPPSEHILGPYKKDQKLIFTVTPTGAPVDFFVFLESDREAATVSMFRNTSDKLLLASRKTTQETRLETTVPKGSEAVMYMESLGGKSSVKVKITSP